ncbi:hypothetical protein HPB49_022128 [Dermacentor silvarum]|uniref:Uncharacterized protein n=1 Tax=Dermacentor silvarum TaxID=543639 RepID=A0ACB8DRJ9_DERSI|nr:hypothetical protein HPB49_022128 [Dermacentor silvarum]
MIKFTGRVVAKQFVKSKPNPDDIKVLVYCSVVGMAHDFELHQGGAWKMPLASRQPSGAYSSEPSLCSLRMLTVIKAACILHNFLSILNADVHHFTDRENSFGNVVPGHWRQGMPREEEGYFRLRTTRARNFEARAADARNLLMAYF